MHVQVLVGAEAPAEVHVGLVLHELAVPHEAVAVGGAVHRVVGLVALLRDAAPDLSW